MFDDYSRMTWITFLRNKSKRLDRFKVFKSMVENQIDGRIKCLRSNRGEFISNEYVNFYEEHGIRRHFSALRTP